MRHAWTRPLALLPTLSLCLLFAGCSLFGADDDGGETTPPARLQAGVYEFRDTVEVTEEDFGVEGVAYLRGYLQLREDSTYLLQGYMSSAALGVENILVQEERGRFRQLDSLILKTGIEMRTSDPTQPSLATWEEDENTTTPVRALSAAGFQTYDEEEGEWTTWTRATGAADLQTEEGERFLDPAAGYTLALPASWTNTANTLVSGTRYDLRAFSPPVNGATPNVLATTIDAVPGQTLEARMNAEADALDASANVTIISRDLVARGGVSTAVIVFSNVSSGTPFKQKLVLFAGSEGKLVLHIYSDLASMYDQNRGFQAIDASLKFY